MLWYIHSQNTGPFTMQNGYLCRLLCLTGVGPLMVNLTEVISWRICLWFTIVPVRIIIFAYLFWTFVLFLKFMVQILTTQKFQILKISLRNLQGEVSHRVEQRHHIFKITWQIKFNTFIDWLRFHHVDPEIIEQCFKQNFSIIREFCCQG